VSLYRLFVCCVLLGALSFGVTAQARADTPPTHGISTAVMSINGHASEVHAPPEAPCRFENRMDLAITDEGIWFECVCEALLIGTVCDWYELGPAPDAAAARKHSWRYVTRATQKQQLAAHRWPRFVTPPKRISAPTSRITTTPAGTVAAKCTNPFLADDAWAQAHGC
jgi:hypothetical protein